MDNPARHYRDLSHAPIVTSPLVRELAGAALAALARAGIVTDEGPMPGDKTFRIATNLSEGPPFEISCSGPSLPDAIPAETILPADVGKAIPWAGTYRLIVSAPLKTFDLYWREDSALRILQFSRGDWETRLLAMK